MSGKRTIYRARWGNDAKALEAGKEGRWVTLKAKTQEEASAEMTQRAQADGCKLGQMWTEEVR